MKRNRSKYYEENLNQMMLYKKADDNDDNNDTILELINQEVFAQLSKKYSELIPYIIGFKEVEKIDDGTILTSTIVSNGEEKLIIPAIYALGKVDATSYIYKPDVDIIFALTKKVINMLFRKNKDLGIASSEVKTLDSGNIRRLFVPPKTWSPKIASSSVLPTLIETQPVIKTLLLEKIATDTIFRNFFEKAYPYMAEHLEKEAQEFAVFQKVPSVIASSLDEIKYSESVLNKEAAVQEYVNNGLYIQHGKALPTKSLVKVASAAETIDNLLDGQEAQVIGKNAGCFRVVTSRLTLEHVLVLPIYGTKHSKFELLDTYGEANNRFATKDYIGIPDDNCSAIQMKLIPVTPETVLANVPDIKFVFFKHNKILGFLPIKSPNSLLNKAKFVFDKGDAVIINLPYNFAGLEKIVINKNSDQSPLQVGKMLLIGDKNIKIYTGKIDSDSLMDYSEYSARSILDTNRNTEIIKVTHNNGYISLNGNLMTKHDAAERLLKEGFDKYSIYSLLKEAKDNGQAEAKAISAKIDVLTNLITTTLGEVKKLEGRFDAFTQNQNQTDLSQLQSDQGQMDQSQMDQGQMDQSQMDQSQMDQSQMDQSQLDPETQAASNGCTKQYTRKWNARVFNVR